MSTETALPVLKASDFASDQDVRWCPGCGDYSILAQMKKVLPTIGIPRENTVFVSGIGCSSRFPYYMNTYGIHSIHGRAPAVATGVKTARPDLFVWVITGDGDALSIGGNHLMHAIRRNLDINIVLFNNRIYGLTKGQYSPTSPLGKVTKSTPAGSVDNPLHPLSIAIGCEATFVARTIDVNIKHLGMVLTRAAEHRGTAFVEVYQNCNVFNDGAFEYATDKATKNDNTLQLEHGKPLVFGENRDKGIRLNGMDPEVVELGKGITEDDLLFHDEKATEPSLAYLLSRMRHPDFPEPIGVFRAVDRPLFDVEMDQQISAAVEKQGEGDLDTLFNTGDTWLVEVEEAYDDPVEASATANHLEQDILNDDIASLQPREHPVVSPDTPVGEVLNLLVAKGVGCAAVVDTIDGQSQLVGIFSERDALMRLNTEAATLRDRPVSQFMTAAPETLKVSDKIAFAMHKMSVGGFRHIPILDDDRFSGMVSVRDIVRYATGKLQGNGAS
ncbi:MAG: CBS domain-containing protein [Planctomycetota bacterium]|nr:MAG: CBS domain-containing protein [Planctomycetota bacterium]REJ87656.1 MAG: CBS domain-containing protein [Planctomycetota bacterium]REJ97661.1 MAG: CBS domain-containing protein [Planctomycetota bacterium]REK48776.1 MAG: CBS domain-containing protein [Planctomycetota bacterium]